VVLFEKQPQVGGQIVLAAKAPQREQMAGIVRWLDMETQRLGWIAVWAWPPTRR
jgi:NADPH-dependent 2,4-dienoyl-CoA reductase/sulfur reductase-like enzyme